MTSEEKQNKILSSPTLSVVKDNNRSTFSSKFDSSLLHGNSAVGKSIVIPSNYGKPLKLKAIIKPISASKLTSKKNDNQLNECTSKLINKSKIDNAVNFKDTKSICNDLKNVNFFKKAITLFTKNLHLKHDPAILSKQTTLNVNSVCSAHVTQELKAHEYEIGSKLSEGNFAKVYLGKYRGLKCAIKVVDLLNTTDEFRIKFLPRELKALCMLNHSYIIAVYDIIVVQGKLLLFMELAHKGDLLTLIQETGAIPENYGKCWFKQLVNAIQYIHFLGLAHRDLKAENVLFDKLWNIKLSDFGFCKISYNFQQNQPIFSETYCGSLAYSAPELLQGKPYNAMLSDIWSLGIVLYVMLNNAFPFQDSNLVKMRRQQLKRRFIFVENFTLSNNAQNLIRCLLEPDLNIRLTPPTILRHPWLQNVKNSFNELH